LRARPAAARKERCTQTFRAQRLKGVGGISSTRYLFIIQVRAGISSTHYVFNQI